MGSLVSQLSAEAQSNGSDSERYKQLLESIEQTKGILVAQSMGMLMSKQVADLLAYNRAENKALEHAVDSCREIVNAFPKGVKDELFPDPSKLSVENRNFNTDYEALIRHNIAKLTVSPTYVKVVAICKILSVVSFSLITVQMFVPLLPVNTLAFILWVVGSLVVAWGSSVYLYLSASNQKENEKHILDSRFAIISETASMVATSGVNNRKAAIVGCDGRGFAIRDDKFRAIERRAKESMPNQAAPTSSNTENVEVKESA
jgi:hypothetical protein